MKIAVVGSYAPSKEYTEYVLNRILSKFENKNLELCIGSNRVLDMNIIKYADGKFDIETFELDTLNYGRMAHRERCNRFLKYCDYIVVVNSNNGDMYTELYYQAQIWGKLFR